MEMANHQGTIWGAGVFERGYAARSGLTVHRLRELGRTVRPCRCDDEGCEGFMSVSLTSANDEDTAPWRRYWPWLWRLRDWLTHGAILP